MSQLSSMQAVILAGGLGTRLSEETNVRPKPMVEIGGKPILWHIMKLYSAYSINDFIICCGYKGYMIKEYFANYSLHSADVTFDFAKRTTVFHTNNVEHWRVTLVDTGDDTATGGRLKRIAKYLNGNTFCCTYGDGLANLNIAQLVQFHNTHRELATITAVQPPGRFGSLAITGHKVSTFIEKPLNDGGWINGGYFVLEPQVLNCISGDDIAWEGQALSSLAHEGQLNAYKHNGFWQAMDTLRDCRYLNSLWNAGNAPWAVWNSVNQPNSVESIPQSQTVQTI